MIFSVWQPDGGYEYFESGQRHGIGDDLPDVKMPPTVNNLGVPAQDVGRPVPAGARFVGRGDIPRGVIAPMGRGQVTGLQGSDRKYNFHVLPLLAIPIGLWIYFINSKWNREI